MSVFLQVLSIIGIVIGSLAALVIVILLLPTRVIVDYKKDILIYVKVLFIKLTLYPEKEEAQDIAQSVLPREVYEERAGTLIQPLTKAAAHLLKGIRINNFHAVIPVTDGDPARLAISYGRIQAIGGAMLAFLQNVFIIDVKEYRVIPDFDRRFADERYVHFELRAALVRYLTALFIFTKRLGISVTTKGEKL